TSGPFKSRQELLKVSGLGPKAYEQALRNGQAARPMAEMGWALVQNMN
nr:helix-hairpin-helix domain-containing protein [Betaproteobacteria bacterium]